MYCQTETDSSSDTKRETCFDPVQRKMLSLNNLSSYPIKIRSIVNQAENTSKGYVKYMIYKSTLIADVDLKNVLFEQLEPRDDFAKSLVNMKKYVKEQVWKATTDSVSRYDRSNKIIKI